VLGRSRGCRRVGVAATARDSRPGFALHHDGKGVIDASNHHELSSRLQVLFAAEGARMPEIVGEDGMDGEGPVEDRRPFWGLAWGKAKLCLISLPLLLHSKFETVL
jgi:hypothetical protein